jgi:hypothetical protein
MGVEPKSGIQLEYEKLCAIPSDINEHLPRLYQAGMAWEHITEFGVRQGVSTAALLAGQSIDVDHMECIRLRLNSYDVFHNSRIDWLKQAAFPDQFNFQIGDTRTIEIEPTMCLFIDTWHTYEQMRIELFTHARNVMAQIIMHDTETFGNHGEDGKTPALLQAIADFLTEHPEWKEVEHYPNNNGLMVLGRSLESQGAFLEQHKDCAWCKEFSRL